MRTQLPPEIRKACLILGVRADSLTKECVLESWKRQIIEVHPDKGGDSECAIYLNTAKETLLRWLNNQGPNSSPGPGRRDPDQPAPVPLHPYPFAGAGEVVLPLPETEEND